ncbi:actin, putative [Entamoeba invadens IP1]|uniref:Actin, putative n=1 Tax=Entamoeba invadens IP1 TaxID=370355 RepID=L7FL22_ENTIV|nr:actin, putative [Entamoeba invadens IP1]ELP86615.1 actin, putative [Entamoeba invadens IP1]|eukprot:XP_004185961.1 actin, putative [Entamoeba invadens IP1]
MEDENNVIVIDNGSSTIRAGFAGDDCPRSVFPTVVGVPKTLIKMIGCGTRESYVGEEAISRMSVLHITHPIHDGKVVNYDDLRSIWHHTFYNELRVNPEERSVILTEDFELSYKVREQMSQYVFEEFEVPSLLFGRPSVMAMFASGRPSGIVVMSGESTFRVEPIYEGFTMKRCGLRTSVAGNSISETMKKLLSRRTYTFKTTEDMEVLNDIQNKFCYCALNYEEEEKKNLSEIEKEYELPDYSVIKIGKERFEATEAIFRPADFGIESMPMQKYIVDAINKCDIYSRRDFNSNIIVAGGNTMYPGFAERLENEVKALSPQNSRVRVVAPEERIYSAWIGGSIVGSLSSSENMFVTKEEYNECGPQIVNMKSQS